MEQAGIEEDTIDMVLEGILIPAGISVDQFNEALNEFTSFTDIYDYMTTFQTVGVGDVFTVNLVNHFMTVGDIGSIGGVILEGPCSRSEGIVDNYRSTGYKPNLSK